MREYLVNADFDLSLRPGRVPETADGRGRQAVEMPLHLLLLGDHGCSVLVDEAPAKDFLAYVERAGLPRPRTSVLPDVNPDAEFVPFGWNSEAATISGSYARPAPHPPLAVVKRVNGRRFAADLERQLFDVDEILGVFTAPDKIEACIASRPPGEEWLLKSEHGNAGLGNRRLRSATLSRSDWEVMQRLLDEDVCLLLERWRQRVLDIATVFTLEGDGGVEDLQVYEIINTADGAYIGSLFDEASETLDPWRPAVTEIAMKVARRLAEEGYFGPVCLDHFVWRDGDQLSLRPLADLNARLQVSAPVIRLWRSWGGDRVLYWRLFAARKLRLPPDYRLLEAALAHDAFDSRSRVGVLVTSPFHIGERRLRRIGVLLAGTTRAEVEELDRRLREQFER